MLGFEPRISGVGSDHSTNWATTTAPVGKQFILLFTRYACTHTHVGTHSLTLIHKSVVHGHSGTITHANLMYLNTLNYKNSYSPAQAYTPNQTHIATQTSTHASKQRYTHNHMHTSMRTYKHINSNECCQGGQFSGDELTKSHSNACLHTFRLMYTYIQKHKYKHTCTHAHTHTHTQTHTNTH